MKLLIFDDMNKGIAFIFSEKKFLAVK